MSKKEKAKGALRWLSRPGYSKNAYNPVKAFNFRKDLLNGTKQLLEAVAENERNIKKDREELAKETEKLNDEQAFQYYVDYFGHDNKTLEIAQKTMNVRRYSYYVFTLVSLTLFMLLVPISGFLDILAGVILVAITAFNALSGLKSAWRYHQIKSRRMFVFFKMFENPLNFLV